jgi:hypothetical protein
LAGFAPAEAGFAALRIVGLAAAAALSALARLVAGDPPADASADRRGGAAWAWLAAEGLAALPPTLARAGFDDFSPAVADICAAAGAGLAEAGLAGFEPAAPEPAFTGSAALAGVLVASVTFGAVVSFARVGFDAPVARWDAAAPDWRSCSFATDFRGGVA